MTVAILWCVLGGLVGLAIGQKKGRTGEAFLLGFLLGPIGWLLVGLGPSMGPKCPHCGGSVEAGFTACRHCGRDLPASAAWSLPGREPDSGEGVSIAGAANDLRECPHCGGLIARSVAQCRHCQKTVRPLAGP
jgi:predicted amidophosphoribosyltransferase